MKHRSILMALLLIIVFFSGCKTNEEAMKEFEDGMYVVDVETGEKSKIIYDDNEESDVIEEPVQLLSTKEQVVRDFCISENMTGYCMGDTVTFCYKYVPSSFDANEHYIYKIIDIFGAVVSEGDFASSIENAVSSCFNSALLSGDKIVHAGEDVFMVDYYLGDYVATLFSYNDGVSYGAFEDNYSPHRNVYNYEFNYDTRFAPYENIEWSSLRVLDKIGEVGFNDGVLIYGTFIEPDRNYCANVLYRDGFVRRLDSIRIDLGEDRHLGIYSEDVFWGYDSFYDLEGNRIIDLTEYQVINSPYFENGEAELVIWQNGKYWTVSVDKAGIFIEEPKEYIVEE